MSIAFFDLDRTLLAVNSGTLWIKSEFKLGHLSAGKMVRAAGILLKYHFGFADIEAPLREAIRDLEGVPEVEIRARTHWFFDQQVAQTFRPGAAAALQRHRDAGEARVLLTTSSIYLAEPVARVLDLDGYLANAFVKDADDVFTGAPIEPLCFGAGKVVHAEAYATERGVDLKDCAFYSDSVSDLPMLEAVGRPVCIGPDPKLRRIAKTRGWPIEDWDR